MFKYDFINNAYKCIYLIVNHKNKSYYCGKAIDLHTRLKNCSGHPYRNDDDIIYILEQNVDTIHLEYMWLWWFKHNSYKDYKCLNKDFNTGLRFKVASKNPKITLSHVDNTNYHKYCKLGYIKDCSGLITA